jgi:spermidine synthase
MNYTKEDIIDGEFHSHVIDEILFTKKTKYQKIEIIKTKANGIGLFIDGRIQHVELDEYVYSEIMVHSAMIFLKETAKNVLCIGGGPGGIIREVLKYDFVVSVEQIDIDNEIIEISKKYLSHITQDAFNDSRYNLIIEDATNYLKQNSKKYDLIINDLSEPLNDGASLPFFKSNTLNDVKSSLTDKGIYVSWGGSASTLANNSIKLYQELKSTFQNVYPLYNYMQSYGTSWFTFICSDSDIIKLNEEAEVIDTFLTKNKIHLTFFDGLTFKHISLLPKNIRKIVQ